MVRNGEVFHGLELSFDELVMLGVAIETQMIKEAKEKKKKDPETVKNINELLAKVHRKLQNAFLNVDTIEEYLKLSGKDLKDKEKICQRLRELGFID